MSKDEGGSGVGREGGEGGRWREREGDGGTGRNRVREGVEGSGKERGERGREKG